MKYALWIEYEDESTHKINFKRVEAKTPQEVTRILRRWIDNQTGFVTAWLTVEEQSGKQIYTDCDIAKRITQEREIRAARSQGESL